MAKRTLDRHPERRAQTRCAIYTRKSTEEGLDQEFNTLNAQREACAAYVLSQRHEGWTLLPDYYDDGGYSGGNMDRPGMKRLMADVRSGKVDVIVVYKVDRLTRALSDFARIVETLDEAGASFVSITQAFNTTTSMGRLTLNVLLSFAQFEREVISERVRDKIAASKRKGIWMGGTVPLGYDVVERKLVINEAEAEIIRHILCRYLELGSVRELQETLKAEGILTKVQTMRDGSTRGGVPFARGPLYHLLKNPIYIGSLPHKKLVYPGQHQRIVDQPLWNQVQQLLAENGANRQFGTNAANTSLLAGLIFDEHGHPLTPSHCKKGERRYRYYISTDRSGADQQRETKTLRLPAWEIERMVREGLGGLLANKGRLVADLVGAALTGEATLQAVDGMAATALRIPKMPVSELRKLLLRLDVNVAIRETAVEATYDTARLVQEQPSDGEPPCIRRATRRAFDLPGQLVRRGQEIRLVFPSSAGAQETRRDPRLVALLVKGQAARRQLQEDPSLAGPAAAARRAHLSRLARASYLAPVIVTAIYEGRQPQSLTARTILRAKEIPLDWDEQRRQLGFDRCS
jgi:DNA invertase Pin-like site-specific DNA recombinase